MRSATALVAAAAVGAMLTGAALASAQETGAYLGAGIGQSKLKDWCNTGGDPTISFNSCEATDTAWKLYGGYRFNRYFAAEGSYIDWGEVTAKGTSAAAPTGFDVSAKQNSLGIAAVGSLPLRPEFAVFAKAGFLYTEQKTHRAAPSPSSTVNRDETEFHYGVGARYALGSNWGLRAEWENTDKLKVQLLSVGAEYRF